MPRPAIGSSRLNKPGLADRQPARLRDGVEIGRLLQFRRRPRPTMRCASACARSHFNWSSICARTSSSGLRGRRLLVGHLDDVEAELRLHEVADLPGLQRERHLVELRHHLALAEEVEVAALDRARSRPPSSSSRARRNPRPALTLRQQLFRLLLHGRFVLAFGLEQDVAGADLFRRRVLLLVVLVRALDVLRRDLGPAAHRLHVDQRVPDLALLGHLQLVLVLLEVRRDLRVGRVEPRAELVGGEGHDGELDLLVAPLELLVDVVVG